jgi:hypothetical protein
VPSGCIETSYLGHIRFQRLHRRVSTFDTDSYAMEVEIENIQEGCRYACTRRGHACHGVCDTQEYLPHHGKILPFDRHLSHFMTDSFLGPLAQC